MKTTVLRSVLFLLTILFFAIEATANALPPPTYGNISTSDKYAWSETSGWVNFRPFFGGGDNLS